MASTPTLIPIEAYLRTNYHPDADYVDGEMRAGDSRFERWGRFAADTSWLQLAVAGCRLGVLRIQRFARAV
jgi:hypothetical protein